MFLLKKIITSFFMPLTVSLVVLVLGWAWIAGGRRRRSGLVLMAAGVLLLGLAGWGWLAEKMVRPLEDRYPPLVDLTPYREVKWVVVLGGGCRETPGVPAVGRLSASSLERLAEGIRLHRQLPGSLLLVSGGTGFSGTPVAFPLAEAARELGVNPSRVILEARSRDTEEQAREIARMVGREALFLVTSAVHLPRALDLFRMQGLHPIPAPGGYLSGRGEGGFSRERWLPSGWGLVRTEAAVHEYLGLAWNAFRRAALASQ